MFLSVSTFLPRSVGCFGVAALLLAALVPLAAREHDATDYGTGLIVNIPLPAAEVAQTVAGAAQNGIICGTKEYKKDEYVSGATAEASTNVFPAWKEGGKVFYKVRKHALDPINFKNSNDVGTLAVRYVVEAQGENNTVLRIDAIFVEEFRHVAHASNGSVESSEYKSIQDRLDELELMKKQAAEAENARHARLAKKKFAMDGGGNTPTSVNARPPGPSPVEEAVQSEEPPVVAAQPGETLEQHVANLRRELERLVKVPGAPLKSAPFHSASTLKSLPAGTQVLIVISTPYWFGVETRDGEHGWIPRDRLELLP